MASIHVNPIDGYQCSDELRAQLNLTNDHQKKEKPHLKHVLTPPHGFMSCFNSRVPYSLEQR
jgi:hypothetical protein